MNKAERKQALRKVDENILVWERERRIRVERLATLELAITEIDATLKKLRDERDELEEES